MVNIFRGSENLYKWYFYNDKGRLLSIIKWINYTF